MEPQKWENIEVSKNIPLLKALQISNAKLHFSKWQRKTIAFNSFRSFSGSALDFKRSKISRDLAMAWVYRAFRVNTKIPMLEKRTKEPVTRLITPSNCEFIILIYPFTIMTVTRLTCKSFLESIQGRELMIHYRRSVSMFNEFDNNLTLRILNKMIKPRHVAEYPESQRPTSET
jgi:hypothetical protein